MAAVALPRRVVPRRVLISRGAVEDLARRTGTSLPWPTPTAPSDRSEELVETGLLQDDGVSPEAVFAMELLHAPEVLVDVDLAVRRGSSYVQLRSWQRWRDGRVAAVSTAGGEVELAWFDDDLWQAELARAVEVTVPRRPVPPPDDDLRLPLDLLLGTGAALRQHRSHLFVELSARTDVDAEQVRRLHAANLGRMRAVVSGAGRSGVRKAGVVSWALFADGWRALTPYVADGVALVDVHRVAPTHLAVEVAALVTQVRS